MLKTAFAKLAGPRYHILILVTITVGSWVLLALPLHEDLSVLYRYWDGPMYITVAKTFYNIPRDNPITNAYGWSPQVFAPFLLMYPLAIRLVAPILGYHWGMVFLSVAFSALAAVIFYTMLRDLELSDQPLWLAILFLFVPYRWLIYRSVGASEPMFLALLFLSLFLFAKRRYALSFLAAAIACDTRIQGILLVPTYLVLILIDRRLDLPNKVLLALGTLVIPVLFYLNLMLHAWRFGDFLAYLDVNRGMIHPVPFWQMVDHARHAASVGEYINSQLFLVLYAITLVGLARLWSIDRSKVLFVYSLITFIFVTLIVDEDLSRFMIPVASFTWVLGFKEVWRDRKMQWVLPVILLLTYLYAWNLIPVNQAFAHTTAELLQWRP
jgi:hypothetical protein